MQQPPSYQHFTHQNSIYQPNRPNLPVQQQQPGISINKPSEPAQFQKKPEVRLYSNPQERAKWDNYADLYSLIMAAERLETIWIRHIITDDEYTPEMQRLIKQYRAQRVCLTEEYGENSEKFFEDYCRDCRTAKNRLLSGLPATVDNGGVKQDFRQIQLHISQVTQEFITMQDALELGMNAVDQLQPQLTGLLEALNNLSIMNADHQAKDTVRRWVQKLNGMSATEELPENEIRQLQLDMDKSYKAFQDLLRKQ